MALFFCLGRFRRCVLSSDGKNQRSLGVASKSPYGSSQLPPDPCYGGRLPEAVPRIRRGRYSRLPPLPRRCRWLGTPKKAVRLDEESAPVATSRRGWVGCGRMRFTAPVVGADVSSARPDWDPPRKHRALFLLTTPLNLPKRNAVSQEAFLPTFFSKKVGQESVRGEMRTTMAVRSSVAP